MITVKIAICPPPLTTWTESTTAYTYINAISMHLLQQGYHNCNSAKKINILFTKFCKNTYIFYNQHLKYINIWVSGWGGWGGGGGTFPLYIALINLTIFLQHTSFRFYGDNIHYQTSTLKKNHKIRITKNYFIQNSNC